MIPSEYRSQIEPAQFFHEVLTHRWRLAEKAGHDVPMAEAVQSYIKESLPEYRLDSEDMKTINEEADSGVVDDEMHWKQRGEGGRAETVRSDAERDEPVNPVFGGGLTPGSLEAAADQDDQDAAVWASS